MWDYAVTPAVWQWIQHYGNFVLAKRSERARNKKQWSLRGWNKSEEAGTKVLASQYFWLSSKTQWLMGSTTLISSALHLLNCAEVGWDRILTITDFCPTLFFRLPIRSEEGMKKNIVKDVLFLGQSRKSIAEDRTLALVWDTLNAHLLECVGLAANWSGVKKRSDYHPDRKWWSCLILFSLKKKPTPNRGRINFVHSLWGDFSGLSRCELESKDNSVQSGRSVSTKWII